MRKLPVLVLALLTLPALATAHGERPDPENPPTACFSFDLVVDWLKSRTSWLGLGPDSDSDGANSKQTQEDGAPDADPELGPYVIPSG